MAFSNFPSNYRKILLYSVDITKEFPKKILNRKIFPTILSSRDLLLPFNDLLYGTINHSDITYRLLIKDRNYNYQKLKFFVESSKLAVQDEKENVVNEITTNVLNRTMETIEEVSKRVKVKVSKNKIKQIVKDYISKLPEETIENLSRGFSNNIAKKITNASILANINGDIKKSTSVVESIEDNDKLMQTLIKQYKDEFFVKKPVKPINTDITTSVYNIPKIVDNKNPQFIIDKKVSNFRDNLINDSKEIFNQLSTKDIPIKVRKIDVIDKKVSKTELEPTLSKIMVLTLELPNGRSQIIKIEIPKILDDGTFIINGKKKVLINQLSLFPITFPKPYEARFESSYSTFNIYSKQSFKLPYLDIFIATYHLPMLMFLSYKYGFENVLNDFKIKYEVTNQKPPKNTKNLLINKGQYVVFSNVDIPVKEQLVNSLIKVNLMKYADKITKPFPTNDYFSELILLYTEQRKSLYLLDNVIDNVVDPVSKQILINRQYPHKFYNIVKFMINKCVDGYKDDRNSLEIQRIKANEVFTYLLYKKVLSTYTEFREQYISGNKDAKIEIKENEILTEFVNSPLVTELEYANPIEELSSKTKTTPVAKGVGGLPGKEAVSVSNRNVHDTYFGNIDPLDTPEGNSVGIVQHLTVDASLTSTRGLFQTKKISDKEKQSILSPSSCLIPFIENNDGPRVMFAANQVRQSLPLKIKELPYVMTGYENILASSLSEAFVKRSPCNGIVEEIQENTSIIISCNKEKTKEVIDITPVHLHSGSGKNTLSNFNLIVNKGDKVSKGQLLAEGSNIKDGNIALGTNLLTSFMPYKGYNFEDGIVISESLAKSEKLTSLHGIEEEAIISVNDKILEIVDIGMETKKGDILLRKTIGELEEILKVETSDEEEISSGQVIFKSPGGRVIDIEVFCNTNPDKFPKLRHLIDRTNKKYDRSSNREKFKIRGKIIEGVYIRFKIQQSLEIRVGDKLTNRHGAKGIISYIEKDEFMPMAPWGERVQIITNPIGIISRMNVGQLYELYTGLVAKKLGEFIIANSSNTNKIISILKSVFNIIDKTESKIIVNNLLSNLSKMSTIQYRKFIDEIRQKNSFPIVVPPFNGFTYQEIKKVLSILGLQTSYKLKLPEFSTFTNYKVPIGYIYWLKLEHLGREKLSARSTGPITGKTMQPTAGKKREGGQRVGELDYYSFLSYNATIALSELFGALSDDHISKNEMISDIISKGETSFRQPKTNPTKEVLNAYMVALMVER